MAQPGTIVDMVVADDSALEFLRQVGFFIENFSAAQHPDAFRAVFRNDFFQTPGSGGDGFFAVEVGLVVPHQVGDVSRVFPATVELKAICEPSGSLRTMS